ncbi:hypothetical protein S245_056355, partial [Arachis hypogaea]
WLDLPVSVMIRTTKEAYQWSEEHLEGGEGRTKFFMHYMQGATANSELSSHQKKIFKVDDHIGVAIAGLTADGRVLSRYMRNECINYSYTYESPLPVGRLVVQLADKAQ